MSLHTESLAIITSRPPLTLDEWCQLLELRKEAIGPHLDRIKLEKLSEVRCLYSENHLTGWFVGKACSGSGLHHEVEGIFGHEYESRKNTSKRYSGGWPDFVTVPADGKLSIWGLTRKKQWVIAILTYKGDEGYKGRGRERATHLRLEEVPLKAMLKLGKVLPQTVFLTLSKQYGEYVQGRRQQLEYLSETLDRLKTEDAFALHPKR